LRRALAFYASHGIAVEQLLTDNGSAYRSVVHAIACRALGIRHLRTRPYRPQTNGKAERFIRTMVGGWAYGAILIGVVALIVLCVVAVVQSMRSRRASA